MGLALARPVPPSDYVDLQLTTSTSVCGVARTLNIVCIRRPAKLVSLNSLVVVPIELYALALALAA
jgi:hypothetical protein